ncbi:MAG: DNA polymerase III subunit alpha [Acutalibacteraceae bacterium]|nr:DNA polymerase III subunit alpha [Acutalibacteraceae bacterium]
MSFVHLHVHSEYSLLDGACRISRLVDTAIEQGANAVTITDHGNMYGAVDFYKEAVKKGIKPIIGCEVYMATRSRFDKTTEYDRHNYHLVLLCENNTGYQNLIKLVSKSWTEGFYGKPRIDKDLLEKHHEGLICLSACLAGEIPQHLLRGDYTKARELANYYNNLFGKGNFYLEIQNHKIKEQLIVLPQLIQLSEETGIPLVATNDCHYINKEDSEVHNILLCIQTNHTIKDEDKMEFQTDEFYFKTEEEMSSLFPSVPQAISNTQIIADRCNVTFEFGKTKLPHFDVPNNQDHFEYFKDECYKGLYKYYGENPDGKIVDRLEYELKIVKQMGYVDYYLIVNDFIQYAKRNGIPVGPGRGSGAGSLAAYCIGITGIDPIKYNLLFERFLNPERVSMPDFDIDFCTERRQEVIDYVVRKYGNDHVAQIITFGTMAAKGGIRDVARAMAIPYSTADAVAKLVPNELHITLQKALEISTDLKVRYDTDYEVHKLIDTAMAIEGTPRHASKHAAGVVITEKPVSEYVPLAKNDDAVVTQYTMTTLEELGLLKMDFLGLRNLTVIHDAEVMIKRVNPDYSEIDIDENDPKVFKMLSQGNSEGVFQFESGGMKSMLTQLKPESVEDLIAAISLYRPGPMDSIPKFIENRHNPSKITYKHPLLKDILDVTYGCIVYQEQVMQIFRSLAGYSLGRADIVRRAMSKKKREVMEREQDIFINGLLDENGNVEVEGCLRRGVDKATADSIYAEMESFASYAFNKSHAAAYANVSYKTAWLKYHYPKEYMAALLTSVLDNFGKLANYTEECARLNIKILPPHINYSFTTFTVNGDDIRFGLMAIKNLGKGFIENIIEERKNGLFTSFYDFCKRMYGKNMNSRAVESLIKCGAFDNLGYNRREMITSVKAVLESCEYEHRYSSAGQMSFFDTDVEDNSIEQAITRLEDFTITEKLAMEKEMAGMYLSGHPMNEYDDISKAIRADKTVNINNAEENQKYKDGDRVNVLGVLSNVKIRTTKNNQTMATAVVEDKSGNTEVLIFPQVLSQSGRLVADGEIVKIFGTISMREDEAPKILCNEITPIKQVVANLKNGMQNNVRFQNDNAVTQPRSYTQNTQRNQSSKIYGTQHTLYIRIDNFESELYKKVKNLLEIFDGGSQVIFALTDNGKKLRAPRKLWVMLNEPLVNELKYLLGEENVFVS